MVPGPGRALHHFALASRISHGACSDRRTDSQCCIAAAVARESVAAPPDQPQGPDVDEAKALKPGAEA